MTEVKDALGRAVSRRSFLGTTALAGLGVAGAGTLLAGCGGGSGTGGSTGGEGKEGGGPITWANWANPGEATRFKEFSADYTKQYGTQVTWQQVVGDYQPKIMTQLAGGAAPDAFYVNTEMMSTVISSGKLVALDDFLASADSPAKVDDFHPGLLPWCKGEDGKLYGLPVDCNPLVFWFNKGMLQEAGVTTDPAAAFEAGTWNQATLDDMLTKIKATGKRGLVVEAEWSYFTSIITALGGTAFDPDSGKCVWDTDAKALEILAWLFDHFKAETITYGGSLPKGQGAEQLFYAGQLAMVTKGRWILPNLKKLKNLQYDMAPYPSADGKTITPVTIPVAAMSVQTGAKDKDASLKFLARYCNADGQKFRLSGGGNAVPSVSGLDDIVLEDNLPPGGKYFNEVAKVGYAIPLIIATNPKVATNIQPTIDATVKSGADSKTFAKKIAAYINNGGK
ncbi:MAG: extracellular solute-binding protein [Microlunatus sp.]